MSLESRHFVATAADIETMARDHVAAFDAQNIVQTTYLKALVATAQAELGIKIRERNASLKAVGEPNADQMAAVAKVQDRFYTVVLRVCTERWPRDSLERNRRSNYARSSYGTLRAWLVAGHDLSTLAPSKVTKAMLAIERNNSTGRKPKQSVLERRADRGIESLRETLQELAKVDQGAAISYAEKMLSEVTQMLTEMGRTPVRENAKRAFAERRPLRTKEGVFWPVQEEAA